MACRLAKPLRTYSILTVGDGLVSQIPAVIVSVSAALLLSKGRDDGAIDQALGKQLGGNATSLMIVSGLLAGLRLAPRPAFLAVHDGGDRVRRRPPTSCASNSSQVEQSRARPKRGSRSRPADQIGDSIHSDEIHLEVAPDLVATVLQGDSGIEARIEKIRRYIAEEYGFVLPSIRMTDNPTLERNIYRLKIQGVPVDTGFYARGSMLALIEEDQLPHLQGERVKEPVYKACGALAAHHEEARTRGRRHTGHRAD